jgi:hypothetical protein
MGWGSGTKKKLRLRIQIKRSKSTGSQIWLRNNGQDIFFPIGQIYSTVPERRETQGCPPPDPSRGSSWPHPPHPAIHAPWRKDWRDINYRTDHSRKKIIKVPTSLILRPYRSLKLGTGTVILKSIKTNGPNFFN